MNVDNFGALRADLYSDAGEDNAVTNLWYFLAGTGHSDQLLICLSRNGDVVEYRQEQIPKSKYQENLELESEDVDDAQHDVQKDIVESHDSSDIRFWSDYSRVYYHPGSLHKLAEPPDWQDTKGDWNYGQELFRGYDQVPPALAIYFRY